VIKVLRRPVESTQYTSFRFAAHLVESGIDASTGTVGDAYDNALMESAIGLYKTELIKKRGPWKTLADVELATTEYIDWFNTRRLHGAIGHIPPAEHETSYYAQTEPAPRRSQQLKPPRNPARFSQRTCGARRAAIAAFASGTSDA
jgi:Integrase core domain